MGKSAPPPAPATPNGAAIAAAQGAANKETAIAQYGLNATNQVTPQGTLSYSQIGNWSDGTPRYQATTTLSPDQQALYDKGVDTQKGLASLANMQTSRVSNVLNSPFDLNSNISTQQSDMATKLLDPVWRQREQELQSRLANQGIQLGSEAYRNASRDFGMQRDNAYNSALLAGRAQATQEALTQRNQPLNEISALLSGSQVSQPNIISTPTPGVAPTDVVGAYGAQNQAYGNQLAAWNASQQGSRAAMSGLFGLGAAGLGGWAYGGFR